MPYRFNRQNHNIVVTKLSDMNVPAWLLRIVMSFLSDRSMVVRYRGATSTPRSLPGGGPQGTLLGLLLFLVLINDAGFPDQHNNVGDLITSRKHFLAANRLHLKYVDDLSIAESIPLKENVKPAPNDRPRPDPFHCRTGHELIPENSEVYQQISMIKDYASENQMKLNLQKTKFMIFNTCKSIDFMPSLSIDDHNIDLVEEMKILGVIITSDLKFSRNTEYIVERTFKRIWMIRHWKNHGASESQLLDVYIKQVRSVLELAVPAWHSSLTISDKLKIERVQKSALHVIFDSEYESYISACDDANLLTLKDRRLRLCLKFTVKSVKHPKHSKWFKVNTKISRTRQKQPKFCPVIARTTRFDKSPISFMTKLLNQNGLRLK